MARPHPWPSWLSLLAPHRSTLSLRRWHEAGKPRAYHSYERSTPAPFPPAESAMLAAALARVSEHGFSHTALQLGARDAGYVDVSTNLLPRGVFDLVYYHLVTQRLALHERVQFGEHQGARLDVEAKVRALALARLRANAGLVHRWHEALAVMAQPAFVAASLAELARLADEMWFLAGDGSVDSAWYSKRAGLAAVYAASEVFMTQDRSAGFRDTEAFVDARLHDVGRVGGLLGAVGDWAAFTGQSAINVARSKGVRL